MLIGAVRRLSRDSLARNSLLIMATTVTNGGLGYLYWMLAARAVPPERIGTATAVISAATAVSMIANLGAGHMFIQRLPGSDTATWSRIVGSGLLLASVTTTATATAAALAVPLFSGNFAFLTGSGGPPALTAAAVAVTLTTLLDNLYVAHRAGRGMLIRNLAVALGKIITLFTVLAAGLHGAGAVLLSYVLPTLLISLITIATAVRHLRPEPSGDLRSTPSGPLRPAPSGGLRRTPSGDLRPMTSGHRRPAPSGHLRHAGEGAGSRMRGWVAGLRAELPHLGAAVTGHHLINLTQAGPAALLPVLVTARLGADANAHFYLAWMTASMLFMVSPAVASALYAERTNAAAVSVARAAAVVLAVVGAPTAVLLFAGDRILALFSPGYAVAAGPLLQILVLAALPDAVVNLAVAHWRSQGRFRRCRRLNLVRAGTCLALAWMLLPGSGVTGAGVAWLTGQTAAALLVAVFVATRRRHPAGPEGCLGGSEAAVAAGRGVGVVADGRPVPAGSEGCRGGSEAAVAAGRGVGVVADGRPVPAGSPDCPGEVEAAATTGRGRGEVATAATTGRGRGEARGMARARDVPQESGKRTVSERPAGRDA
ncbi:lipopolysaccharide biosynthesis protein [Actinoplanes utahensis]|uniref:lipopolysaccharide biosynthesis protein n=1 Tax=Actinoplanes utahensis TaxID=1869 RepID=UPI000A5939E7|nr:oligosaccharide flippase family protein [Actinoplanes utahensis]GIF29021.1 hypothetical protein Aut01nite_20070 [Actinoplanes utahensis]